MKYIIIEAINLVLDFLEGYLALFTIAGIRSTPKKQIIIMRRIFNENKRYSTK